MRNMSRQPRSDETTVQRNIFRQLRSDETTEKEKCYDPQDTTLTFVNGDDDLDFLCIDYKSLRAKMSCGHAVTPTSLTDWCRRLLDQGECRFVCGQTNCDVEWPFKEVCKMALLTPEEMRHFEKKLLSNAAKDNLNIKVCPGCKSRVTRADLSDLSVECTVCTADKKRPYRFCCQCLREWKGPAPRSDRCQNDGCINQPLETLTTCPDIVFEEVEGVTGCPCIRACPTCGLLVEHNRTKYVTESGDACGERSAACNILQHDRFGSGSVMVWEWHFFGGPHSPPCARQRSLAVILFVPTGRTAVQSTWPSWSPWEGYLMVLRLGTPLFYWGTSTLTSMGNNSDTWRGVIGRNGLPDLNPGACTWHQDTLGRRSMIDFVVVSSDLRPYVLDTRVKRGAELSTDHHLVVSWIRWQRRKLDGRPGRPKRIVRVCWERLAEPSVREVFNSHLRKSFSQIPREAGDIESEWTMFSASIVDAAVRSCGHARSLVPVVVATPSNPVVDTGSGELLTSTGDIVGRWKKYFEDLLNPTDLPSNEEVEAGDSEVDSSITRAEVTEVVRKLLQWQGAGASPGRIYAKGTGEENSADSRPSDSGGTMRFSSPVVLEHWTSSIPTTGTFSMYWSGLRRFAAECEAAGMRISTSKSEAMVLDRKRVACPLRVGGEVLPQVEEFKYLGVLFTQTRSRIQAAEMSFLRRVAGQRSLRDRGGVPDMSHRRRPGEDPGHAGETTLSRLAWERLGVPPEELEEVSGVREVLGISAQTAASATRSRIKRLHLDKMDSSESGEESSFSSDESSNEATEKEKCYDPQDTTLTFVNGNDDLDFLCIGYKSLRAKMSCGHAVTPTSLTDWCRRLLDDQGECRFVCGQTNCDVEWPFKEVCKMALLTPKEMRHFKRKLLCNAAKNNLTIKVCPGCKSRVTRADLSDLCVECTVCTADKKRPYRFCCQCLREWKGPAPRSDRCQNDGCINQPLETLRTCPDIVFEEVEGVTGCPCIRACPTCGLVVEHNTTQCKNMRCPRFLCIGYKSLRAKMSCGHAVTPTSLTDWCRRLLDEGECRFVCGQTNCDVEWPFKEVCKMALLTPEEMRHFEKKLLCNAAKDNLTIKVESLHLSKHTPHAICAETGQTETDSKMKIQLKVSGPRGDEKIIDLCENEEQLKKITVMQLKKKIAQELKTSDDIRMVFRTEPLEEMAVLSSYGIRHILHLAKMGSTESTEQSNMSRQQRSNETTVQSNVTRQLRSDETTVQRNISRQPRSDETTVQRNISRQPRSDETTVQRNISRQLRSDETTEKEKCYDPQDTTLTFVNGDDDLDFLCIGYKSLRAKMSCGHAVTPTSLTDWCRRLLDQGECRFVCGQTNCDVEWPFKEVCKMALLTPEEMRHFEKKLLSNAAKDNLNIKVCPGCKSRVTRADLSDLSVECTVCTADKKRPYRFCCQCLREWKGPAPRSDRCQNDGCINQPLETLRTCPDIDFKAVEGVTGCPCIRACPTCGLVVEHNSNHCKGLTCPRCKVKFCFVCLKLAKDCLMVNTGFFSKLCPSGVAPRQTSIPVWQRK
ncbi:hypothetical protein L3Q82_016831 [Scortum barcoo]|uniref:Uncharacterized protein n=1 Tax=Scortum barcoo TaxID=214431 RepID=A0ACB8X9F9_9TELE|nr:hypothetical protein L3Q82_016831 [Scortum barcoo]